MAAKIFKCKSCGFEFSAIVTNSEISTHAIPCLGCGSFELEIIGETETSAILSKKAEAGINCHCKSDDEK